MAGYSQQMHRHEHGIGAQKSYPEMKLAQDFTHGASKHLGKPEMSGGKHRKKSRHGHNQVKMGDDEIGVVHINIQRRLSQNWPSQTASDEQRNKAYGEQQRSGEAYASAPDCAQPIEGFDG